tara:strand:+ start:37510 stop:38184 length:675 start_codon:yes stop_codon:yes gene_type:complete
MSVDYSIYFGENEDSNPGNEDYIIPIFSVPLFHYKVENWPEKKEKLMELYNKRLESNMLKRTGGMNDVETDYHANFDNEYNYSDDITDIFESELVDFADASDLAISVNSTWFERSSKNSLHSCHNHGPIGYSAVCFIQFDPKYHTPTVFMNPVTAAVSPCSLMPPGIREGSLILFPSYLLHFTNSNESDVDRIILSFNLESEEESQKFSDDDDAHDGEYYSKSC